MKGLPLIVDIKRDSHEDGPGIRSVVFFKGCPLRCVFCHNPESQNPGVEIAFMPGRCVLCGICADACEEGAIDLDMPGRIHRDLCTRCGACADTCEGGALRRIGKSYTVEALTELLLKDESLYLHSGGGVTLSGGECTMYPDYLETLLKGLKAHGIHVALETSGHFEYGLFRKKILPYLDLVYYDIKLADPSLHKKYLGMDNEIILSNLKAILRESGVEVHPRIPLIPGVTASTENLSAIVELLCDAGAEDVSLLPYNPLGLEMAVNLGRERPPLPEAFMKPEHESRLFESFEAIIDETGRRPPGTKKRGRERSIGRKAI